jgi:hypothetical protein
MGWHVMNTTTTNGTLNIARLIEEAEAQLMGERASSCSSCGNCTGKDESAPHFARCAERAGHTKHTARRSLAAAPQ